MNEGEKFSMVNTQIRKSLTVLLVLLIALLVVPTVIAGATTSQWLLTIHGDIDIAQGGSLSKVTVIQESSTPAIDSHGSASIWNVTVKHTVVGIRTHSGSDEHPKFKLRNSIVRGQGTDSIGLILDVPVNPKNPAVKNNVFQNLGCAIQISVDIIFQHLPLGERLAAAENMAKALRDANTFEDVQQPTCIGGRG